MTNRHEKEWRKILHRSIAITGKLIGDLVGKEIGRFLDALSRPERVGLVRQLLCLYQYGNITAGSESRPLLVTQQRLRATPTSEDAESEVYRALAAGAKVEPGPLIAYLRRGKGLPQDHRLVLTVRRARQEMV